MPFPSFYQVEGVQFLVDNKRVLIADEMSVGKTAQAVLGRLEIENRTGKKAKTLVVTRHAVMPHWRDKIPEYCNNGRTGKTTVLNEYTREALERVKDADIVISSASTSGLEAFFYIKRLFHIYPRTSLRQILY